MKVVNYDVVKMSHEDITFRRRYDVFNDVLVIQFLYRVNEIISFKQQHKLEPNKEGEGSR